MVDDVIAQGLRAACRTSHVVGDRQARLRGFEVRVREELRVVAAGGDQRVDERVAVGEVVLDAVARRVSARSSSIALAGVSRPTALPIRACLVGK